MLSKSKVYFTKSTAPEKIVDLYKIINKPLPGKIAVKVHSGARGNPNFIHSDFFKPIMDHIKGTIVECNSSTRERSTTEGHMKIMEEHGWISLYGKNVEILDSEKPDLEVEIPEGKIIKKNFIGKGITKYDSVIVMTHFKAHGARTVGGIAGAFKQLSIGFASSAGKIWQHTAGKATTQEEFIKCICNDNLMFKDVMLDAASAILKMFKGKILFVNMMINICPSCDCFANAKKAEMKDIGILISEDPVAIDKACLDLLYQSEDPKKQEVIEVLEKYNGKYILEEAEKRGLGSQNYELIMVD